MESNSSSPPFEFEFSVDQDLQLDLILERIAPYSDDIIDFKTSEYFTNRWLQVLGDDNDDAILHLFFKENQEYLYSLNGDILFRGNWRILEASDAFIIEKVENKQVTKSELFDLAWLSDDFFILKKHGDQSSKGKAKYLFMGREELIQGLSSEEILELLRQEGSNSSVRTVYWIGFLVVLGIILAKYFQLF